MVLAFLYQLFGFNIESDLPCPELVPALSGDHPGILFKLDDLPESLGEGARAYPQSFNKLQFAPGAFQFEVPNIARYRIEAGRVIRISPFSGSSESEIRAYLLGTAMGALLLQRRLLPLHVCAVGLNGRTHAFCGPSGAGKSTLALAFCRHGIPLLCDDVGLAVPRPNGEVMFYPGFPRIKLWRDTLGHFNIDETSLARDLVREEKFHMAIGSSSYCSNPMPLGGLYALEKASPYADPRLERLNRHGAISLLIEHTYRTELVRAIGHPGAHLQHCVAVAKSVPAFKYHRPWSLEAAESSVAYLCEHIVHSQSNRG